MNTHSSDLILSNQLFRKNWSAFEDEYGYHGLEKQQEWQAGQRTQGSLLEQKEREKQTIKIKEKQVEWKTEGKVISYVTKCVTSNLKGGKTFAFT